MTSGREPGAWTDFLIVDGDRLECRWIGPRPSPGGAPTLVFLHEGLGCAALWRDFPDCLAARVGLGGFVFSRLGYGRSDPAATLLEVDYHRIEARHALPAVLAAAGIERAIMIGHSDGGTMALQYAGTGAGGIDAVITLAAHVFNEPETIRGIEETERQFASTDLRDRLARYHGSNVDWAFRSWSRVWLSEAFRTWNIEPELAGVRVPVLVIQGEDDHYGTPSQVTAIADAVSGPVETWLVPGCGHAPHAEKSEEILTGMEAYLRRLPDVARWITAPPGSGAA